MRSLAYKLGDVEKRIDSAYHSQILESSVYDMVLDFKESRV